VATLFGEKRSLGEHGKAFPISFKINEHSSVKSSDAKDRCKISITGGLARSPCQVYASSLWEELCKRSSTKPPGQVLCEAAVQDPCVRLSVEGVSKRDIHQRSR